MTETESEALTDTEITADGEDESKNKKYRDTKVGLSLRMLAAAYILYLAYGLIQGFGENVGNDRIFMAIAIVVFLAAGGGILVWSAKKLIKREYADADEQTKEDED